MTSQIYGSNKRVVVSTVVTGANSGRVTFRSGATVIGIAQVSADGWATLTLPKSLAVGTYSRITASLVATQSTQSGVSAASAMPFQVVKTKTSKVTVTGKKFTRGKTTKVTVKVAKLTNGTVATGKIELSAGKKKVHTATLKKGKAKVSISKKYTLGKTLVLKAKYVPPNAKTTSGNTSKKLTLKAK